MPNLYKYMLLNYTTRYALILQLNMPQLYDK